MPEVNIPETLDFNANEIKKMAKRQTLATGYYRWRVMSAERKVNEKSGNFQIQTQVAALRDPDDANSAVRPYVYNNLTLPKSNPDVSGHKAPNTAGLIAQILRACFPEDVPAMPRRNESGVLEFNGEEIEKGEEEAKRQEVMSAVAEKMSAAWADPNVLVDQVFYADYGADKTGQYMNVMNPSAEIDQNKVLTDAANFFGKDEETVEEPAAKPAAKKAPAKANGKKR